MNLILSKVFRFSGILYFIISFLIFNDGGFVAVKDENGNVVRSSVRVAFLPLSDAERLNEGIFCEDMQELAAISENFIS